MSEYQYYEFQTVDRRLDQKAMDELDKLSSRAEVTPTSLSVAYNYSSFRGDPDKLIDKYFDAHLYLANWGTRRLLFRFPLAAFDLKTAQQFAGVDCLTIRTTAEYAVVAFKTPDEDDGDGDWEEGEGCLDSMIDLRADLLAGDFRALYIGWLGNVQYISECEDPTDYEPYDEGGLGLGDREPPVPPGLGKLTEPLKTLAEFLRIDLELIATAAVNSAATVPGDAGDADLAAWVARLPAQEKDGALLRLLQGEGAAAAGELRLRFRKEQRVPASEKAPARRTVAQLLAEKAGVVEKIRRAEAVRAAKQKARLEREAAAARERRLDSLVGREEETWAEVETAVSAKLAKEYVRSVELLKDLVEAARREGQLGPTMTRLLDFRERHRGKRTFIERLDGAKLTGVSERPTSHLKLGKK